MSDVKINVFNNREEGFGFLTLSSSAEAKAARQFIWQQNQMIWTSRAASYAIIQTRAKEQNNLIK